MSNINKSDRKHPLSVPVTNLAKLAQCELMVALDIPDAPDASMIARSVAGERDHERFHIRAVLNAGTDKLGKQLSKGR